MIEEYIRIYKKPIKRRHDIRSDDDKRIYRPF